MAVELHVLALFTNVGRYIFVYDADSIEAVTTEIWNKAADPDCGLNWFDAIMLIKRLKHPSTNHIEDYEE